MTENISKFLQTVGNEYLAALTAHCEDGELSYYSCSCLVGGNTAAHKLYKSGGYCDNLLHMEVARVHPHAALAEQEFKALGGTDSSDSVRREALMPLLLAEQSRRAAKPATQIPQAVAA